MILSALSEVISISSIFPFTLLITDQEKFKQYKFVNQFISQFSLNDNQILILLCFIFIVLIFLSSFIRIFNIKYSLDLSAKIANDFGTEAYFKSLNQPYEDHLLGNSSKLISTNLVEISRVEGVIYNTLSFGIALIISFSIILTLLKVNLLMTLTSAFILGTGYLLMGNWSRLILRKNSFIITEANKSQVKLVQEGLGAIREILLEGLQSIYRDKYKKFDYEARTKLAQKNFITAIPRYSFEALALTLMILFALFYSVFFNFNNAFLPTLTLFALASQKLLPAMQMCYSSLSIIRANHSAIICVIDMLSLKENSKNYAKKSNDKYLLKKNIAFRNVSFSYKNNKIILNNINLQINKGEKLGITGISGSGKSTLIDLILGLIHPSNGNIYIDNNNLHNKKDNYFTKKWQRTLSHVPQNIFLNDASIKENIAFGIPPKQINEELLEFSIKNAMLSDFLLSLSNGVNTIVGERGFLLSGGQRQRIGIARALYKQSNILILDEATNALDYITEQRIFSSICKNSLTKTLIIISHNKDILNLCDRVIVLKNGKIIS